MHLLVGPNGAGKTTFYEHVVAPATHLPFVNADAIAAARWPGDETAHAYEASQLAADQRARLIGQGVSFATETVFSHGSKIDLVREAISAGYLVTLHVALVPVELSVARVEMRVEQGGHAVPEEKTRARFMRLWRNVVEAIHLVQVAIVYDNSSARRPYRSIASFRNGTAIARPDWPDWAPDELRSYGA